MTFENVQQILKVFFKIFAYFSWIYFLFHELHSVETKLKNASLVSAYGRLKSNLTGCIITILVEQYFFAKSVSDTHYASKVTHTLFWTDKTTVKYKIKVLRQFWALFVNALTRLYFKDICVLKYVFKAIYAHFTK